jgi:hypothetical protein
MSRGSVEGIIYFLLVAFVWSFSKGVNFIYLSLISWWDLASS